jgi:hypothetical protein
MFCFLIDDSEKCTSLQEREGAYWVESFLDIPASVLSRLNRIVEKHYSSVNAMASSQPSQSGMMSKLSTEHLGAESQTLYVEDSHAKTSANAEHEQESQGQEAVYGNRWQGSLARFDLHTSSWKTLQGSLFEDSESFSEIWPPWGMMQRGVCSELPTPSGLTAIRFLTTNAFAFSSRLPTQTVFGNYNRKGASATSGDGLATALRRLPTPTVVDSMIRQPPKKFRYNKKGMLRHLNEQGVESQTRLQQQITDGGPMNPEWVEWFMGWPIGMTALQPLAMDKFQQWLNSHGKL